MQPIYTAENTNAAYQLNWSLALFGITPLPSPKLWPEGLRSATESDGIRILSINSQSANTTQFFVSTQPESSPSDIVRCVKGRLQHLIRAEVPKAFRRNYHIQSVGDAKSSVLDEYVSGQTSKHPMADPIVQARFEANQSHDESADLAQPAIGTYGQYLNSLQIVLENTESWREVRESKLQQVRRIIVSAAQKKSWRLSRVGLLSNHAHILLGASVTESPQSVALSLMNNISYVYEMKPILKFSYYVGTFGGYDRGAVRLSDH